MIMARVAAHQGELKAADVWVLFGAIVVP